MKTVKIAGRTVELYDSIEDLPMWRFHKFNKYLLIDSGVGSDLSQFQTKIAKIKLLIKGDQRDKAYVELDNAIQCLNLIISELRPKYMSFACLVYSIDGSKVKDLSDDTVKEICKKLSSEKQNKILALVDSARKKFDAELRAFFPQSFNSAISLEHYALLKQHTMFLLGSVKTGVFDDEKLEHLEIALVSLVKPENFLGEKNPEFSYENGYEELCLFISKEFSASDVKAMKVLAFYNAFYLMKKVSDTKRKSDG